MPVTQALNSPGLTPIVPKTSYGDVYAGAGSVRLSAGADIIDDASYKAWNRPGTVAGGLSYEMVRALSSLTNLSDYSTIVRPLTLSSSNLITGKTSYSGGVRTGSLELNMLDIGATVRMASGQFIGQETPLLGNVGGQGPLDQVLAGLSEYNRLPSRILDYAVGVPLAWMGVTKQSVSYKNADGSPPQPFQQSPIYWNAIANSDDAALVEMAELAAEATVGPALVPALKAQLLAIFRTDKLSLTGLSSGNDRTDYLAKKQAQQWYDYAEKYQVVIDGKDYMKRGDPAFMAEATAAKLGVTFSAFAQGAFTALPFVGTGLASWMEPVSPEMEQKWLELTPDQRRGWLGQAMIGQVVGDLAIALPLFSGIGAALNLARSGAAGIEFAAVVPKIITAGKPAEGVLAAITGARVAGPFVTESGNAALNMAKQAAWALGKPGVRMPAVLTEGGTVGRLLGSRFAVPEVAHLTNLYDATLHVARLALAEGIASWGINWALKSAFPEYNERYGQTIDNSHWVSESSVAGAVDMIGLFTGGTLGASTVFRATKGIVGAGASRAGLRSSPFNLAYENFYGGQTIQEIVSKVLETPLELAEKPIINHIHSVMQRWVLNGKIAEAEANPARAAEILMEANISRGEAVTKLAKIIKAAQERRWGVETEGWTQAHEVARKTARALLDDINSLMAAETGPTFWARQLRSMKDPVGRPLTYSPAGFKEYTRQVAKLLGKDPDVVVAAIESSRYFTLLKGDRALLEPWQRIANTLHQRLYDHYSGILYNIEKSGTSESARLLFIERADHLFAPQARRYTTLYEEIASGARATDADLAMLEALRKEIIEKPEITAWWARQKNWNKEGTRSVQDISDEALYSYIKQIEEHLPTRRETPGAGAVEGELNDLALELDKGGIWTLAYKPTVLTSAGAEKVAADLAQAKIKAWEVEMEAETKASAPLYQAYVDAKNAAEADLVKQLVDPIETRWATLRLDMMKVREAMDDLTVVKGKQVADLTGAELKQYGVLERKIARLDNQLLKLGEQSNKAYQKVDAVVKKDPAVIAAQKAMDANAARIAELERTKPTAYRVGIVSPDGFTPDFREISAEVLGPNPDWATAPASAKMWMEAIEADRAVDPTAGNQLLHVTPNAPGVLEKGLLSTQEMTAMGLQAAGLGGGNPVGHVSLTYSVRHAEAMAERFRAAIRAANGDMSMEDVLLHFRTGMPVLTKRGKAIWRDLRKPRAWEDNRQWDDYADNGQPNGKVPTMDIQLTNGTGTVEITSAADYRAWAAREIQKELRAPYQTADEVAEALSYYGRFSDAWRKALNERTAAPLRWGPNGELLPPEVVVYDARGLPMTLDEANERLALIIAKYPGDFQATATAADKAAAKELSKAIVHAEYVAKHPLPPPTPMERWTMLLDILENDTAVRASLGKYPVYQLLQRLDSKMEITPGGGVLLLGDGSKFLGKSADDVAIVRASVKKGAVARNHLEMEGDYTEVKVHVDDLFVHLKAADQPFHDPLEAPLTDWSALGPDRIPVTHVRVRDPETGEYVTYTSPWLEYPNQGDLIQIGNRNWFARQWDNITQGYRTWRITEYMKGQTFRLFTSKYEIEPEQVDALLGVVMRMGYQKWGPGNAKKLATPLGYQAAANLRRADIENAAGMIFGRNKNPLTGEWELAPLRNRQTGAMEVPDYADMLVDGFRQAWTLNLSSAVTSRLYALGVADVGFGSQLVGSWLAPLLRYTVSPIFKASELVESAMLNAMRGQVKGITPELRAMYSEMGMPIRVGQLGAELGAGDMMAAGMMGGLPTKAEAAALHGRGIADLPDLAFGDALIADLKEVGKLRRRDSRLPGWVRDGWDNLVDPTIFKDPLAADLSVKVVRDDLPKIMAKTNPTVYKFFRDELKVPDQKLADFIVQDRYIYQSWLNGTATWQEMIAHHAKYNPALREMPDEALKAFYKSPEWETTEAIFRISARAAQSEAYGVHYFGAYRSSLERSLNHPLLGLYPASWAYKTAKEWARFLFDNRVFGNGELRLGATPAAYIQSVMQGQGRAWAQNSNGESLDEWLRNGPYGNAFFVFNLLLPGDWANLPFPASRSIRMVLRQGNLNPIDHVMQNIFGPQGRGGIGGIRDINLIGVGIMDAIDELSKGNEEDFTGVSQTLTSNDGPLVLPVDWQKMIEYPSRRLTQVLNGP